MKLLSIVLLSLLSQLAMANVNCDGRIQVPSFKSDADVAVDFDGFEVGGQMGLWASITSDDDTYIVLKILSTEPTDAGLLVKTQYLQEESSTLSFVYSKGADGSERLTEFKGIEGGVEFGPGQLSCHAN
jgi:hypothetical protein